MKFTIKDLEVEMSLNELKDVLRDGYLEDALKFAERYFNQDTTISDVLKEANAIVDNGDSVFELWHELNKFMPKGSKHKFTPMSLRRISEQNTKDIFAFDKMLRETYIEDDYFDIMSLYKKYQND